MPLTIRKLKEHIGAEVQGVDLTAPIDTETFDQLRHALCEYAVLVFHNQDITDEQHVAFSEGFGPLEMTMPNDPIGDGGPIGVISNLDENGDIIPPKDSRTLYTVANTLWHSDGSFKRVPLRGSLLSAKVIPPEGGETEFASLTAAYAALPEQKKTDIEDLIAEHSIAHSRETDRSEPDGRSVPERCPSGQSTLGTHHPRNRNEGTPRRFIHDPYSRLANRRRQNLIEAAARMVNTATVCVSPRMERE